MEQSGEKSQDPTPHRRQQAREEGQVVHSQDLAAAALLTAGLAVLLTMSGPAIHFFADFTHMQLGGDAWLSADRDWITSFSWAAGWELSKVVLPVLGVLMLAGVLAHLFQIGFLFLPGKLLPDVSRINPLSGFSRIFSLASAVQMLFGCFKIAIVGGVAYWSIDGRKDEILSLVGMDLPQIAVYMSEVLMWTSLKVCVALSALAILDYAYRYWRHEQSLRMTPQEVREELKTLQGDPQMIARRRNVQRQLAMNRLNSAVPKADVVITHSAGLTIAIQYEMDSMKAPVIVAKGAGATAARIRRLALEAGVPIIEKKQLAQALYKQVEPGHTIPDTMYAAVAEVLAYVYRLKGKAAGNDER